MCSYSSPFFLSLKTDRIESGAGFPAKMRAEGSGHIKLKLGYIAVKNRSQQQVEDGISMEEARLQERVFFETNPLVAGLDRSLWGMETVIERIVDIQSLKVAEFIPKVNERPGQQENSSSEAPVRVYTKAGIAFDHLSRRLIIKLLLPFIYSHTQCIYVYSALCHIKAALCHCLIKAA